MNPARTAIVERNTIRIVPETSVISQAITSSDDLLFRFIFDLFSKSRFSHESVSYALILKYASARRNAVSSSPVRQTHRNWGESGAQAMVSVKVNSE